MRLSLLVGRSVCRPMGPWVRRFSNIAEMESWGRYNIKKFIESHSFIHSFMRTHCCSYRTCFESIYTHTYTHIHSFTHVPPACANTRARTNTMTIFNCIFSNCKNDGSSIKPMKMIHSNIISAWKMVSRSWSLHLGLSIWAGPQAWGQAGWASGLAGWPRGGNRHMDLRTYVWKIFPFYRTSSPIGAAALPPKGTSKPIKRSSFRKIPQFENKTGDGRTTDGPTVGRTDPHIEMRGRI